MPVPGSRKILEFIELSTAGPRSTVRYRALPDRKRTAECLPSLCLFLENRIQERIVRWNKAVAGIHSSPDNLEVLPDLAVDRLQIRMRD